jgi:hypothetical protein
MFHFTVPKYREEGAVRQLREPEAVIAIVDDDPSVRSGCSG